MTSPVRVETTLRDLDQDITAAWLTSDVAGSVSCPDLETATDEVQLVCEVVLSPGAHVLTATVTDQAGQQGTDTVGITVTE